MTFMTDSQKSRHAEVAIRNVLEDCALRACIRASCARASVLVPAVSRLVTNLSWQMTPSSIQLSIMAVKADVGGACQDFVVSRRLSSSIVLNQMASIGGTPPSDWVGIAALRN